MPKATKAIVIEEESFLTPKSKTKIEKAPAKRSSRNSSVDSTNSSKPSPVKKESPSSKKRELAIPDNQPLGHHIQAILDKEWKNQPWNLSRGISLREKGQKRLYESFASLKKNHASEQDALEHDQKCQSFAHAIEQSVYNIYFVRNKATYLERMRDLIRHVRKNPERYLKIDPSFTATMTIREMVNHRKIQKREISDYKKENVYGVRKHSDVYCPVAKCRSLNIGSYEINSRSADEGAVTHYECYDCGKKF
jgi:DNA-directed RNA polymerase subunit M/transcription elongation factor TFIIS